MKNRTKISEYKPHEIRTFSGLTVDALNPKPEQIIIEDIAHALSNTGRFGGHAYRFYSVAEHCFLASKCVPASQQFAVLMHDAAEAYLTDIPRPVKRLLSDYGKLEYQFLKVISEKFGFQYPFSHWVTEVDDVMLADEWQGLMINRDWFPLHPVVAERDFLRRFHELSNNK